MTTNSGKAIVKCGACGQRNRVALTWTTVVCGRCREPLGTAAETTLHTVSTVLDESRRRESFGRRWMPENYPVCATCGIDHHKRDRCKVQP